MGIDAERAGHAEIVVGLHHGRREPDWVESCDHVAPACSGIGPVDAPLPVRNARDRIKRDRRAVAGQALPSHGVPGGPEGHGSARCGSLLEFGAKPIDEGCVLRVGDPMPDHRGRIELAGIVQDDPLLGPCGPWQAQAQGRGSALDQE